MRAVFPELREVRGHVGVAGWGLRGHFWLIDPDDNIIDPTVSQFPAVFEYMPWKPGDEVHVGRCMNCGMDVWQPVDTLAEDHSAGFSGVCSDSCHDAMAAELNSLISGW